MLIRFDELEPSVVSHMKGCQGEARLQLVQDVDNKIMRSVLAPGASIGLHTHETSSEVMYFSVRHPVRCCMTGSGSRWLPAPATIAPKVTPQPCQRWHGGSGDLCPWCRSTKRDNIRSERSLSMSDCLFCKIIAGEIPSSKVYEDELCYAFNDIAPQAPTHFLVVPKAHIQSVSAVTAENSAVVAHIFEVIAKLSKELGFDEAGYRVVSNIGEAGQQSVPHLHFHVLAGRDMTWPPG